MEKVKAAVDIDVRNVAMKKINYNPFLQGSFSIGAPATRSQIEIWSSLEMDQQATLCYNESLSLEFSGEIDLNILDQAFQEVLKRHDSLRLVFSKNGQMFSIQDYQAKKMTLMDYSFESHGDELLSSLIKKEAITPFDLENGPCWRAYGIKLKNSRYCVVMTVHHIVCDGWSFGVILKELAQFYSDIKFHRPIQAETPPQFYEYALQENKEKNIIASDYWLQELNSLSDINFPVDFNRPPVRNFNSKRIDILVPESTVKSLKRLSAREQCSFYNTLVAAFSLFISRLTDGDEVVVGLASAHQSAIGSYDLVGHLVNLLPLKTRIDPEKALSAFLKEVRKKMLDAFEHQNFSYGSIVKELKNLKRKPGEIPLLNVVFNIDQQLSPDELIFGDTQASYKTNHREYENFEIFINAVSFKDQLTFECQYNSELFSLTTITNWLHTFTEMLAQLEEKAAQPMADIRLSNIKIPQPVKKVQEISLLQESYPQEERLIIEVWKKTLLTDEIKSHDHFFSLGGHSLLAIEAAAELSRLAGHKLHLKDIFQFPVVHDLARRIHQLKTPAADAVKEQSVKSITRYDSSEAEVSHNQLQVWYLEEMHQQTNMHNLPSALRIKTKVDPAILTAALELLMERHPSMRTSIELKSGKPIQRIHELDELNFKMKFSKIRESSLTDLLNEESHTIFDKTKAPLFKATLFELAPDDYVFFFMVHHAIWDGWSFDIFFEELNVAYVALLEKRKPEFKASSSINYIDYSHWMKNEISSGALDSEFNFWSKQLALPLPILELPVDFKRPAKATHSGGTMAFTLNETQAYVVREYAKLNGVSLFNVFLTAFKITLTMHNEAENEQGDIIVGLPVRGRNHSEIMNTIGYFVNTVALRTKINSQATFEENLQVVSAKCTEALDHQLYPFQLILNSLNLPRDLSRTPVFQSFFSFQDVSNRSSLFNGVHYSQINVHRAATHTDLDLWIKASSQKIEGAFEFRSDLFKVITIQRFCEVFLNLIDNLMVNARKPLRLMEMLPANHRDILLKEWNNTTLKTNFESVVSQFQQHVQENPLKIAIETSEEKLTYRELEQMALRAASGLIESGIGKGDIVGISLAREGHLIVSLLATMFAGAAYLPLDPNFPQERLEMMIEDANPRLIITQKEYSSRFKNQQKIVLINDLNFQNESGQPLKTLPEIAASDLMYVIFTSGSTGRPKGVEITHNNVTNFLAALKSRHMFSNSDKMLAVTTLSFDISVLELFLPLVTGGSLFLAQTHQVVDGSALSEIIEKKKISVLQATPSTWRLLLSSGWSGCKNLRALCGGEAFPADLAQKLIPLCKAVWNMYGPTETTVWSSCKKLSLSDDRVTIGKPIDNTYIYILDEHKKLKPIGCSGEIYIGGAGLANGYMGRADLTKEKFINNPFRHGEKIYATGDLGKFSADGDVICLGRNDGQVKVRGYRIELGEIETRLMELPAVKETAVITKEVKPGDVRILAYISAEKTEHFNDKFIKAELAHLLPAYMIPSHIIWQNHLPKTLNGKIDKKNLPVFVTEEASHNAESKTFTPEKVPATYSVSLEEKVLSIFSKVLGVNDLELSDSFFDQGGNSLLAVSIMADISQEFKVNMPLASLIEAQTIAAFASQIQSRQVAPIELSVIPKAFKSLVAIHSAGEKNPIYFFHGVGGNILNYVSLISVSKKNRPLMALQSHGLDGINPPLESIEDMAKSYIREIKMVQPEGPYILAGGSMGGMIAFEVARQLKSGGDSIEKIIMFDTFGPNLNLKNYQQLSAESLFTKLQKAFSYRASLAINNAQEIIYSVLGQSLPLPLLLKKIERCNYKAIWKYQPAPYHGDLHLIRSNSVQSWYADPDMGWKGIVKGKINTYRINGGHSNFIESPQLAEVLAKLI